MLPRLTNNRFLDAGLKLILTSAVLHLSMLFVSAIYYRHWHLLNYFNMLNLDVLLGYSNSNVGFGVLGTIVMAILFILFLFI